MGSTGSIGGCDDGPSMFCITASTPPTLSKTIAIDPFPASVPIPTATPNAWVSEQVRKDPLARGQFLVRPSDDPEWVRQDIRETVDIAREHDCVLEIIIKDTHTCNQQPWRFDAWCHIAMEEAKR